VSSRFSRRSAFHGRFPESQISHPRVKEYRGLRDIPRCRSPVALDISRYLAAYTERARERINPPRASRKLTRTRAGMKKRRWPEARNARITSIALHACPMKRLGACKHHNPTIRSRLIYLPIKAYWKHVFQGAAAKTGPTDVMRCDAMRGERQREKRERWGEKG